jgi:hypothetical protein
MNSWLTAGEGVLAASIPVVGLVFTFTANRRAQYDRVLTLTAESSAPPIADDRHAVGLVFEPQSKLTRDQPVTLPEKDIAALFRVLWYFQRIDAVYESLRPPIWTSRITRTQALFLNSIGTTLNTWVNYVGYELADAAGRPVASSHSAQGLRHLSHEYDLLRARREPSVVSADDKRRLSPLPRYFKRHRDIR